MGLVFLPRRGGLRQSRREIARFGQQEPADLRHVSAGGDVYQIVFIFRMEPVAAGKIVQAGVNLLEIPWVMQFNLNAHHFCFWRNIGDIAFKRFKQRA